MTLANLKITSSKTVDPSFELLFTGNPVPMFVYRWDSLRFLAVNDAAVERYGYSAEQFTGMTIADIRPAQDRPKIGELVSTACGEIYGLNTRHQKSDGSLIDVVVYSRPMDLKDLKIGLAAIFDVTEQRHTQATLAHMAKHDALTGLPNRASFVEHLAIELDRVAESHENLAVLCLDLDKFKEVNDTFGHPVGDELLCQLACRLQIAAGGAFLARLGGDEFMLIATGGSYPTAATDLADRLFAAVTEPFSIERHRLRVGLSVGAALFPTDGSDATTLLGNGDAALFRAKDEGGGRLCFFDQEMGAQLRERRTLQGDLERALANDELVLFYQPEVQTTGEIVGFEALARWEHPKRGLISPEIFIPLAEESGLILDIGEWALREACREAAGWPRPLLIAVNLSPIQFRHGDLPAVVHSILLETGLAANRLELEVTESVLINDTSRGLSILRRLKALGVRIAIDDFGTGYSSLSYLQSFPFDKIKIDQSFISNVERSPQSAAIVRAVIGLGHDLDISVIAEGVETKEQLRFLSREACDQVQGFFLGRPHHIDYYARFVGRHSVRRPVSARLPHQLTKHPGR